MITANDRAPPIISAADVLAHLARDLSNPPFVTTITELAELWQVECLTLECGIPPGLEDHPELSVRVRGAFGRQLRALPQGRTTTGTSRPAAWDVLAAPLGRMPEGDEIPKPVVLRAGIRGGVLVIEMRIVGRGCAWFDNAAAALLAALEGGIALRSAGSVRVPIDVGNMFEGRVAGVIVPEGATTASLIFRSPVLSRHKRELLEDPRAILRGIVRRVSSLARWHASVVEVDWPEIIRTIDRLRIDHRDLVPFRWERYSIRSGHTAIPAAGWLGTLRLSGPIGALAPYLSLGETMNAGAQASLGLGWYDLAMA